LRARRRGATVPAMTPGAPAAHPGLRALCTGELGAAAGRMVRDIAEALRDVELDDPSVTGQGGGATLYRYLARAFPGGGFEPLVAQHFERARARRAPCGTGWRREN